MSKIDDVTRLRHRLDAATEACEMISGKTRNSLDTDRTLSLALVKLTEIVGEAAANVSKEKQNELSQVPWRDVISMRNRLIHAYFDVDLDIVWQTVTEDLPLLVEALRIIR
ncbi:MAG: DUF86 domain-containing protein [Phormidium tanganyikae FI6-MK23]|jgi:uncharacterized protein with HEPN domain|nr:DUF86 domain-containing protein [Phormidium tanganyikae FI6-MK23]